MTSVTPSEFFQKIQEGVRTSFKNQSNSELALTVGVNVVRLAHNSRSLIRQRGSIYVDSRPFTTRHNVAHVLAIALGSFGLYVSSRELTRRAASDTFSSDATIDLIDVDEDEKKVDLTDVSTKALSVGVEVTQIVRGRTLISKRQLTTYGRAYKSFGVATSVARAALMMRGATK